MPIVAKKRLPDGTFGPAEKVSPGLTPDEQLASLGQQLALEKLKGIQKDTLLSSLGQQVSLLKLQVMQLKGGEA